MTPAASALATTGADHPVPTLAAHPAGRQGNGPLTLVWERPAGETRCRHDFADPAWCTVCTPPAPPPAAERGRPR